MVDSGRNLLVVLLSVITRVLAQSSNVTQCVPEYQWSINSLGQTPCLVGAYLETICSGNPTSVNTLPPANHYIGPTFDRADPCFCNSVTYSVISACGGCQNRTFTDFSTWTMNCPFVIAVGQFPKTIPATIELPSWASLNISLTNNTFDPLAAEREAERADAFPSTTSTSSTSTSTTNEPPEQPTLPSAPSAPGADSAPPQGDSGGLSSGAIAGVTIGVLVAVIAILLFSFWLKLRSKKRRNPKPAPLDEPFSPVNDKPAPSLPFNHVHSRSLSDPVSVITPYMYSASEIDRQPISPEASTYYTTAPGRNSLDDLISPQGPKSPQTISAVQSPSTFTGPRGYTGAAEV